MAKMKGKTTTISQTIEQDKNKMKQSTKIAKIEASRYDQTPEVNNYV